MFENKLKYPRVMEKYTTDIFLGTNAMTPCHGISRVFRVFFWVKQKPWEDADNGLEGPLRVAAPSREVDLPKHHWTMVVSQISIHPETTIAAEIGWLEYYCPIGEAYFQGPR